MLPKKTILPYFFFTVNINLNLKRDGKDISKCLNSLHFLFSQGFLLICSDAPGYLRLSVLHDRMTQELERDPVFQQF